MQTINLILDTIGLIIGLGLCALLLFI